MRNSGDIAAEQENAANGKLKAEIGAKTPQDCCGGLAQAPTQPDPKEILLRRLDYHEDNLIRQLTAIREFRKALNRAGPDTIFVLHKLLNIERFVQNI